MPADTEHILYLQADEKKLWEKLPEALKKGWKVAEEKLDAYETQEEIALRREMFHRDDPELLKALKKLHAATSSADFLRKAQVFPPKLLHSILFTVGAVSLRNAIRRALFQATSAEDIEGIALLSQYRHALLVANAEPVSV